MCPLKISELRYKIQILWRQVMSLCKDQKQEKIAELAKAFDGLKNISQDELREILEAAGLRLCVYRGETHFVLKSDSRIFEALKGLSPKEVWEMEVNRCIQLKFHKELGLTEQQFMNKDFFPFPEERPNALAVIPEIITRKDKRLLLDISKQMSLIEIGGKKGKNYLDLTEHKDLIEIPDQIHWIYEVEDGGRFAVSDPLTSPEQEEKNLKKEKRIPFATAHGIAVIRRFPEILKHHYLDLLNSRYKSSEIPCLSLFCSEPKLHAGCAGFADSDYGVPSFRISSF